MGLGSPGVLGVPGEMLLVGGRQRGRGDPAGWAELASLACLKREKGKAESHPAQ